MNHLYYGDNLDVLRSSIADASIDLIYLDPPFNSQANYNLLFRTPEGSQSAAAVEAFTDTWKWNRIAEETFDDLLGSQNPRLIETISALRRILSESDLMAYIVMMAARLIELHRTLKPTGSLFLHCDPTASHYLKLVLDSIFGVDNYRNEISWRRSNPKSLNSRNLANCRDIIFRYTKSSKFTFNKVFGEHDPAYIEKAYRHSDDKGRYRLLPLLNPSDNRPNLTYEFLGVTRVWRWTRDRMEAAYRDGLVVQLRPGAVPQYKKYLSDSEGRTITNDWTDIPPLSSAEELGYPTQKPLALLERILNMASNPNDIVLDPFCGCGTTVHAAEKLGRQWIGIDITHLAVSLISKRIASAFPSSQVAVHGTPRDVDGARALALADKYQFQWWALSVIDATPASANKKGADAGVDGLIYFRSGQKETGKAVVSVKGGENVGVGMIRDLIGTLARQNAEVGIFVTLAAPTRPMIQEAVAAGFYDNAFGARVPKVQILTVEDLLAGKRPNIPLADRSHIPSAKPVDTTVQGSLL